MSERSRLPWQVSTPDQVGFSATTEPNNEQLNKTSTFCAKKIETTAFASIKSYKDSMCVYKMKFEIVEICFSKQW